MDVHIVFGASRVYGIYSTFQKALVQMEILNREGTYSEILSRTINKDYNNAPNKT